MEWEYVEDTKTGLERWMKIYIDGQDEYIFEQLRSKTGDIVLVKREFAVDDILVLYSFYENRENRK
jgi:hypothetical protein